MIMGNNKQSYIDAGRYNTILSVAFEESKRYKNKLNIEQDIVVVDEDGNEYNRFSMDKFMEKASFLKTIGGNRNFNIPDSKCFMGKIGCTKLKAPSRDKADIHIVIHDLRTNMTPTLGFSIKSQLGSPSTLLNATEATNIRYLVIGKKMNDKELQEINSIEDHLPRMQALVERGYKLQYSDIEHQTFKNNLLFLDTCMPEFIAACLICDSMPNSTSKIKDAVELVAKQNPFGFTGSDVIAFYEHKMKVLLLDAALGMTPAKEWKGRYDANGGYLVVRKDGEIVCYHFYNRNDVEDYLYKNTRFERGSRSRHHFGTLYRGVDGKVYIKLNLQIRFNN